MKITEAQVRKVIKEEIQNVLNEMQDEDPTSLGLTGGKVAGGLAGAVSVNVLIHQLEQAMRNHPEWVEAIKSAILHGHDTIHNVGHAIGGAISENKKK